MEAVSFHVVIAHTLNLCRMLTRKCCPTRPLKSSRTVHTIDGKSLSVGTYLICYATDVRLYITVLSFTIHRATNLNIPDRYSPHCARI